MIYKTINVLPKIQAVPSSRVTVSRDTALHNQLNVIQLTGSTHCSGILYLLKDVTQLNY